MATGIRELTDTTFDAAIGTGVALVDFWAPWCGPCRMQTPILEDIAKRTGPTVTVAKVNVDTAPGIATRFGIRSIPTLIVFRDGKAVEHFVGVQQGAILLRAVSTAAALE